MWTLKNSLSNYLARQHDMMSRWVKKEEEALIVIRTRLKGQLEEQPPFPEGIFESPLYLCPCG